MSIIVPVYKVEEYLSECVDSILSQSFKDYELILIDDGSPDICGDMCDRYAVQDKRIRVIHQANAGQSAARNAGIEASCGEVIAFVDSDDKLAPDALCTLYNEMIENDADIVLGKVIRFVPNQGERPYTRLNERKEMDGKTALMLLLQGTSINISVCGGLYRRNIFTKLRMPVGYVCEDWYITPSIYFQANKVIFVPTLYYLYRDNPQSTMANLYRRCNPQVIEVAQHVINVIKEKDCELYRLTLWSNLKRVWKYVGIVYMVKRWNDESDFLHEVRKVMQFYWKDLLQSGQMNMAEKVGVWSFCFCRPLCAFLYFIKRNR